MYKKLQKSALLSSFAKTENIFQRLTEEIFVAKLKFEARANETVFAEKVSVDTWKTPRQTISRRVSGKAYFTNQRIVFLASGLIGTASVS